MRTEQRSVVVVVVVVVEYKCLGHLLAVQLLLPQPTVNTMNIIYSVCLALVTFLQPYISFIFYRNKSPVATVILVPKEIIKGCKYWYKTEAQHYYLI